MEFQAYAYSSQAQSRTSSFLWQIQSKLHSGESLLLPGVLLLSSAGFVMYEHFSATHGYDSNRNFLAMILVTMLPLAFLENKILACADPLSVMSRFSGKVLLSHACFLAMRVPQHYIHDGIFSFNFASCFAALVAACALLPVCFHVRSIHTAIHQNWDVWSVVLLGLIAALMTEALNDYFDPHSTYFSGGERLYKLFESTFGTGALYIELLAFVPAVSMVCRVGQSANAQAQQEGADVVDTRKRALELFAFLVGFYFLEDVVSAVMLYRVLPLASLGHLAHFALLLDFAFFLLAHLYDPAKVGKLVGTLRDLFSEACAV